VSTDFAGQISAIDPIDPVKHWTQENRPSMYIALIICINNYTKYFKSLK